MTGFTGKSLDGAQFDDVSLVGAEFRKADLSRATFRNVDFTGVLIRGVYATTMEIDGAIENLTVNGIDVMPLVEAELDRRYPDRPKMRPTDAAGFREAWDVLERLWGQTVDRARGFAPELLHERVDGEWSFIETLRHLVFATDAWVNRAILGQPSPWDPLGLPHDEMPDIPGLPHDHAARPSLSQVLALRADRMATVRQVLADLTDERLAGTTEPVLAVGYPESRSFPVRRCLGAIINEEWEHRLFAERDLDALATRRDLGPPESSARSESGAARAGNALSASLQTWLLLTERLSVTVEGQSDQRCSRGNPLIKCIQPVTEASLGRGSNPWQAGRHDGARAQP